ncbi:MAG: hypothetical protein H6509_00045 [Bryobacterales bacterium]|nr:hypothetical protein [Bryobacterales bacterium]
MLPATIATENPFAGLSVSGVRRSFEDRPVRSTIAAAVFGAGLMWGLKATKKNGPIGAVVKGMIAMAVMNRAKKTLLNGAYRGPEHQIAAA